MPLKANIRLVVYAKGDILWKSSDYFPVVADNLGNQVLDDNCRLDPIFCYNDIHWQNRLFVFLR